MKNWNLVCERLKTLWEKEKMLVTSIFFFSHNFLKTLPFKGRVKSRLCGKELKGIFLKGVKEAFLKTLWQKEKMLLIFIFFFLRNIFYQSAKKSVFSIHLFYHLQMLSILTILKICYPVRS